MNVKGREPFGYVIAIEGSKVTLNLKDTYKGQLAGHRDGVSAVTEINTLFGVDSGNKLLVLRVTSLLFLEPKEIHKYTTQKNRLEAEPLRQVLAVVVGHLKCKNNILNFMTDSLASPALGAEAFPLSDIEFNAVVQPNVDENKSIIVGMDIKNFDNIRINIDSMLNRHVAVLGSTGQGKSCFIASILQQISEFPRSRIVVFDINGEYENAFNELTDKRKEITKIGGANGYKIPYVALGRHGLSRLLMPSDKSQRPALAFAFDSLNKVKFFDGLSGAGFENENDPIFFDDCRVDGAEIAWKGIEKLRQVSTSFASCWPHMSALACLVAESHSLKPGGSKNAGREAFLYSNVSPLITRIKRFIDDSQFKNIVDVNSRKFANNQTCSWQDEGSEVVRNIFGDKNSEWNIHIVNLRDVAHDLMPSVLGALLELFAFELFERGQEGVYPTLLVLEEAHHYLRSFGKDEETNASNLAYERLAKEGRKFGLSLLISTQRPSEVSSTVLSQCGTWVVFRLTSEQDLRTISVASEWVDRLELNRVAGLPRQQALIFGSSLSVPVRVQTLTPNPLPKSHDPNFAKWFE